MIWGLLSGLGLGEQLFAAAALVVVAWYLLRMVSMAGTVGMAFTSGIMYVVVSAVVIAVALALGWLDPQLDAIQNTLGSVKDVAGDVLLDWVTDRLDGVSL